MHQSLMINVAYKSLYFLFCLAHFTGIKSIFFDLNFILKHYFALFPVVSMFVLLIETLPPCLRALLMQLRKKKRMMKKMRQKFVLK